MNLTCIVCDEEGSEMTENHLNEFGVGYDPKNAICWNCEDNHNYGICDTCDSATNNWGSGCTCFKCDIKMWIEVNSTT